MACGRFQADKRRWSPYVGG
ncbi:uncharacterized protein G2W53_018383 [Senna tora]|uniref:Uncharacterized protein n=1 Tax=Senna tora TaxID=362788 RepID=A0A834U0F9_9FABA|nr:uncharacterized protein G2W53_018383 [Senna tora]